MRVSPIAVSVGDPAGVGPEIAVRAAVRCAERDAIVLYGDARRLEGLVRDLDGEARRITDERELVGKGGIGIVDAAQCSDAAISLYAPNEEGGRAQLETLDAAIAAVRAGRARALVTGPMSKEAVNSAGHAFTGQTEHLARAAGLPDDAVTMMFLGRRLRLALVTTHLAVRNVPDAITEARVERTIRHLREALNRLIPAPKPIRIAVAGLNPHAGEGGLFGNEERDCIAPVVQRMTKMEGFVDGRCKVEGPRPAETVLREAAAGEIDGVVVMMHDQATIASKLLDWEHAVNVTWGLPFVRTSVDHGVAYEAARTGMASAEGMVTALQLAQRLTSERDDKAAG